MNQLKPINDHELAALKWAIVESYVGYVISATHGIVRIGTIKNRIAELQRKITELRARPFADFVSVLVIQQQEELDTYTKILEDIYAEVNASDDPRSMLNFKTLEKDIANIIAAQKALSLKQENETSKTIADIRGISVDALGMQIRGIELMIALINKD